MADGDVQTLMHILQNPLLPVLALWLVYTATVKLIRNAEVVKPDPSLDHQAHRKNTCHFNATFHPSRASSAVQYCIFSVYSYHILHLEEAT